MLLGRGSRSVTEDYIQIDEALKLATTRTIDDIALPLDGTRRTEDVDVVSRRAGMSSGNKKGAPRRRELTSGDTTVPHSYASLSAI